MIETGTVKSRIRERGAVVVQFYHLQTEAECVVLQATTGGNVSFSLPSVGTQVVCWLESGKNIALGAVFSEVEPVPADADEDGLHLQYGAAILDLSGDKAVLKNDSTDIKTILKQVLSIVKNLTVSTSTGPSGTPLPPTIAAVEQCETLIDTLFR
jgi:phage baseplate assembly protein gpV